MTLRLHTGDQAPRVALEYSRELFDDATAARLLDDYAALLEQIAEDADQPLSAYRLRHESTPLRGPAALAATDDALTAFLRQDGARAALRWTDGAMSYAALNARADHVARALGRQEGRRIGVLLPRGPAQPAAMLAVWKAGACWTPLDGALPAERLRWIAEDAALAAVIGQGPAPHWLPPAAVWLDLDPSAEPDAAATAPETASAAQPAPNRPAYVIYTSGSTGRPKGVEVSHGALVAYARGVADALDWPADAALAALSSVAADLGFTSLWGALLTGRTLRLLDDAECADPETLARALDRVPADVLKIVPSHLDALLALPSPQRLLPRRALILGGEAAPAGLLDRLASLAPAMEIWNHYGPTETTVGVAIHRLTPGQETHLSRALGNSVLHTLDSRMRPTPVGAAGDLWIGGDQLALGYVGAPGLTAERFVATAEGGRLYRTGDRARRLPANAAAPQGGVAFLGRADGQVKINGFRVELGEIETQARRAGVAQAVALAVPGPNGARLALVATDGGPDVATLRARLSETLPGYMTPRDIRLVDSLPLLPNGKIDRRRLLDEAGTHAANPQDAAAPNRAINALTVRIQALFARVLNCAVGPDENFFAAGGDSILGLRLAALARADGLPLTPKMLFEQETPAAVGAALAQILPPENAPALTPTTQAVLDLFREALRRPDLGADEDFFAAGGDSILCLQVAAKARRGALALTPKLVFDHPTARAAADALDRAAAPSTASAILDSAAPVPLRPIQRWFLAQRQPRPGHWNQSILLELHQPLAPDHLQAALDALVRRHPALSMAFAAGPDGGWTKCRPAAGAVPLSRHRVASADALDALLPTLQPEFDLAQPPLIRAALIDSDAAPHAHLLLSIHHLAVDGVSWRVLLDDLFNAQDARRAEGRLSDPGDGPAMALAAFHAAAMPDDALLERARAHWRDEAPGLRAATEAILARAFNGALNADAPKGPWRNHDSVERRDTLDAAGLGPGPRDALLAALCETLALWSGHDELAIEMEAHGRDGLDGAQATAVGWFTSRYPLRLRWRADASPAANRAAIAASVNAVPDGGRGFGLLRHGPNGGAAEVANLPVPPVVFNHHGQINRDGGGDEAGSVRRSPRAVPNQRHPDNHRLHALELDTVIEDGTLRLRWAWPRDAASMAALPDLFLERLAAHLSLERLAAHRDAASDPATEERYPLSPVQTGLLFHALTDAGRGQYLNQVIVRLDGALDAERFRACWQALVDHHPALRTGFHWPQDGDPQQSVAARAALPWRSLDWSATDAGPEALRREADRDLAAGLDLTQPPLMRVTLLRLAADRHALIWTRHHLIADGWCTARLMGEVAERYRAALHGQAPVIDSPPPYRDFIAWLGRRDPAAGRAYWAEQVGDVTESARLPRGGALDGGAHHRETALSPTRFAALKARAARARVTVNTLCQTAAALALARHTGRDDVILGVVGAGRPVDLPGADRMIGLFITTIPLRVRIDPRQPLDALLRAVQRRMSDARDHEHTPLTEIQAAAPVRDALFDTLLVFENYPLPAGSGEGPLRATLERTIERTNYPLSLVLIPREGLTLRTTADRAVIDDAIADSVADTLMTILTHMAEAPEQTVESLLSLLPPGELERQRVWNATASALGGFAPLGRLLSEQAARTPDAVALEWEADGRTERLSYAALDRRSNRLAHWLIAQGCRPDDRVALCFDRSPELVIAIHAAVKAGCAYLPLDPEHPAARLATMLEDGGAALALTQSRHRAQLPDDPGLTVAILDADATLADGQPDHPPNRPVAPGQLAYALFTSGSTGRPKAVGVPQAGLLNRLRWMQDRYRLSPADAVLQKTPYGFDVSVWEFFWPLMTGARLVLAGPGEHRDAARLTALIEAHGVTTLHFVPAMLQVFLDALEPGRCAGLTRLLCSGEALPAALRDRCLAALPAELHNLYGPTEASIDVTAWDCRAEPQGPVPIGRPIANIQTWILDGALNPVPVGVAGELYLSGIGLARGYLGRPGLTAAAFLPNPLTNPMADSPDHRRLYRTGDLARHRPDGAIEYLGRADFQVKIRGQRVELGEIEAALAALPSVAEAVVVASTSANGEATWLTAWIVPPAGQPAPTPDEARAALAHSLPDHMIPAVLLTLDRMPINQNGKIDRKALPQPQPPDSGGDAPQGETETALAALWSELLGHPIDSRDAHFFLAGGHSLLAPRLAARIRDRLHRPVELIAVMAHPVLRDLAAHIDALPVVPPNTASHDTAPADGASYERFEL